MSKVDLENTLRKPAEAIKNENKLETRPATKLTSITLNNERTRNDFASNQNPFASIRRKKLRESGLKELNTFQVMLESPTPETDPIEDLNTNSSGLTVTDSSIQNQAQETLRNLEGRTISADLVINSKPNDRRLEQLATNKQVEFLQAEQQREREDTIRRREAVLQKTREQATQSAKEYFEANPNQIISSKDFQAKVQLIVASTNADQYLVSQIQEEFISIYTAEREKLYQEMNWVKRKYYQAINWCSEKLQELKKITTCTIDTCQAIGKGIAKLATCAYKLMSELDWDKIQDSTLKILGKCGEALSDPDFYLKVIKGTWKVNFWAVKKLGEALVNIITDPIGAAQGTWKFLKQMSSSMGLTQMLHGAWCITKAPYQYLIDVVKPGGGFAVANQNLKNNLIAAKDGVIGALKCACEITGLADCYYTLKHAGKALILYGQGRNLEAALEAGQATMHLAFAIASASSIIATVSTLGAASGTVALVATGRLSLSEGIERVGKHALKAFGKEMAESALSKVPKNVLEEATEKASREAGERLAKETVEMIAKTSSTEITKDTAGIIIKNVGLRAAELGQIAGKEIVEKSGLSKALTESAEILFEQLQYGSKELTQQLIETGLSKAQAKSMAKTACLMFRSSATKKEIIDVLAEEASKRIAKEIEEKATKYFLKSFEKGLATAMISNTAFKESFEAIAKAAGITADEFLDKILTSASKGFKEGLFKGISEAVELAIKKALAKARFALKVRAAEGRGVKRLGNKLYDMQEADLDQIIELSDLEETKMQSETVAKPLEELDKKFEIEIKDGAIVRVEYYIIDTSKIYTGKRDVIGAVQADFT